MSTLAEQVAALQVGDTITATFQLRATDITSPKHQVTGVVHAGPHDLYVGLDRICDLGGAASPYLVSIDSVTPKPLNEPTYHGAACIDRTGEVWVRNNKSLWVCIDDRGPRDAPWDALVQRYGPLTPFVPTPDEEAGR